MKNYYHMLGIPNDASVALVNEAYKKLAQKFHPDRNPDDDYFATWFKEINEAKQVLTNEEQRAEFDYQLSNYTDAYELLKQQHHEANLRRKHKHNPVFRSSGKRTNMWMMVTFAVLLGGIFLYNQESASYIGSHSNPISYSQANALEQDRDSGLLPNAGKLSSEVIRKNEVEREGQLSTPVTKKNVSSSQEVLQPISKIESVNRGLSQDEIDYILHRLDSTKGNKSIHVIQTKSGNIKLDFAIAPILQEHGYKIAGREITSEVYEGISIDHGDNIVKLVIGRTNN